jgi:hypothetical protein
VNGTPNSNEVVFVLKAVRTFTLPISLTESYAFAVTASTGTAVFTLLKNGSSIGSVTFTSSATGVFSFSSAISFALGDVFSIAAPASPDATLASIAFDLLATV